MNGYRKLIVCLAAFAIAAFCNLSDSQAEVIIYIGIAFLTGNVIEHAKEMVTTFRGRGRLVPPVPVASGPEKSGDTGDGV